MPRPTLAPGLLLVLLPLAAPLPAQQSQDPHLDRRFVSGGCRACHRGHGEPVSPMLPAAQSEVCLGCHGATASLSDLVESGALAADVRPTSLVTPLAQPFTHPISDEVFSARQEGTVTCTSCHSPHRGRRGAAENAAGEKRISSRDPLRFEYELCESCHGNAGVSTQNLLDLSRLLSPQSGSYHPVEAETVERSPSIKPRLEGKFVNCSDCHGNSDEAGPAGPHGSQYPYLLRLEYVTADGNGESEASYALCYSCHEREKVLDSPRFPQHRLHVVQEETSCATCHNAHGSVENRALIRFAEETYLAGVSPSASTETLAFESIAPGAGSCYLLCHGVDHDPFVYGTALPGFRKTPGDAFAAPPGAAVDGRAGEPRGSSLRRRPQRDSRPPR